MSMSRRIQKRHLCIMYGSLVVVSKRVACFASDPSSGPYISQCNRFHVGGDINCYSLDPEGWEVEATLKGTYAHINPALLVSAHIHYSGLLGRLGLPWGVISDRGQTKFTSDVGV